jgi:hypothetical protein
MLGKHQEISHILPFPDSWPEVSVHLEGPEAGHLDTGFLGFMCL